MALLRQAIVIFFGLQLSLSAQVIEVRKEHFVSDLQPKKVTGRKYVDVALFNYRNSGMKWRDFKEKVIKVQSHYRAAGIYINIVKSYEIKLKTKSIRANTLTGIDPDSSVAPYEAVRLRGNRLGDRAEKVFNEMSKLVGNSENTLIVSVFRNISYQSYYTREGERVRLNKGIQGFSFPPYSFGNNIPRHLRGVIAIVPSVSAKTISHELGHKLINVSHEGKNVCPRFEGGGVPGLMGYSRNTQIYSGEDGRFHLERLGQSPFVYQYNDETLRLQNLDYIEGGHYRDPIYDGLFFESECL
jgi:hypothetical protein